MDDKPQNSASHAVQPITDNQQNATTEATKESSPSLFVNSEPIREEQVQNAVKFLSHPKVKGSPVIYRRSFLERKGLTKEEIDEAFRLVPDSSPSSTVQPAVTTQDGLLKSASNVQTQTPSQALQPAATFNNSKMGTSSRFHWSHAIVALGLFTVSGAGIALLFKKSIVPRFKSWVQKVVLEEEEEKLTKKSNSGPSLAEEAATAAKAAAAAASDVARASQEMLTSKAQETQCLEELMNLLHAQIREMKSMSNAVQRWEGRSNIPGSVNFQGQEDYKVSVANQRMLYGNGKADFDKHSSRYASTSASSGPSVAPHSKSYIEPWDVDLPQNGTNYVSQFQDSNGNSNWLQENRRVNQMSGDGTTPWGQGKHVKITEIETEDKHEGAFSGMQSNVLPVQRPWVPPQPPPVALPEAAEAIRQPKKPAFQTEKLSDDQFLARSSETTDELQRITKFSESGGFVEDNSGGSELLKNEIQNEEGTVIQNQSEQA